MSVQARDLVVQIGIRSQHKRFRRRSRRARSRVFARSRQWVRQAAAMHVGQVLELGRGQAFEARIGGMRAAGEVGGFEPEP